MGERLPLTKHSMDPTVSVHLSYVDLNYATNVTQIVWLRLTFPHSVDLPSDFSKGIGICHDGILRRDVLCI